MSRLVRQRDDFLHELEEMQAQRARQGPHILEEGQKIAYATWGEDQILACLFDSRPKGYYVDIGAFHPNLYSNTRLLFDRGWKGINVDCNPRMIEFYNQLRPGDVNLNIAVGAKEEMVKFYLFNDWASSNTISRHWAEATSRVQKIEVQREFDVPCYPLSTVLGKHLPPGTSVDFLNIDVEEADLAVIQSNDWDRYRPLVIAIEDMGFDFDAPSQSETYRFLRERGYRAVSRTIFTTFFADDARRKELSGCP